MKQLAKRARREALIREREVKRETEQAEHRRELRRLANLRKAKSLEWERMTKKFPDTLFRKMPIHDVHPDLRARFRAKCEGLGFTMSGKIRRFMSDALDGKIDDVKLYDALGDFDIVKGFGKIPEGECGMMLVANIPESIHADFNKWCRIRGVSMSFKIKQLMVAYLKDIIE